MSYESKWKDRRPTDTINAVQEFLRGKDIHVEETNTTCMGSCYAVTLVVENTNLFVNGKGSSLEFARASAYGELMERVLTKVLFRYNYYDRYSKERDTIFFEDEVLFDEAEYKNHLSELGLRNCDYHSALDVQKYFTAFSSKLVMEPFNTINGEKTKYFPVSVLDVLFGTNGMAFGNTLEEAKTQALSEVFERYCNKEIINKEIIMPQIPADGSIFKDRLLEEIVEVKEKTGLEVTIYDASLGKGYPVISVIFENKENNTYFVKFGAHFDINVATERCLTEMFQGRRNNQSDYMKEKTYLDDSLWRKKNLESILHTGDGYYPVDVVNGGISEYKFEKWPEFHSNSEALEFYTNKLLEISDEVYFKVYKEKGFNVVRYLIPQVSQIYDDIAYIAMKYDGYQVGIVIKSLRIQRKLTKEGLAGVNVQTHLVAMHHVDCPWKPSSIEQREGRGIRQGNENEEVAIYRYVTKGTFDAYNWSLIENKQRFISQVMTSKAVSRSCEDIDEATLSYAEIKAVATGNPLIKEKMEIDNDVQRLKLLKASYDNQRYGLQDNFMIKYPKLIKTATEKLANVREDVKARDKELIDNPEFAITIGKATYTERVDGGTMMLEAISKCKTGETTAIGKFHGFELLVEKNFLGINYMVLRGKTEYKAELSTSPVGSMVKLENLFNGLHENIDFLEKKIEQYQNDLEASKAEYDKPFAYSEELNEKLSRQCELNAQLDLENAKAVDADLSGPEEEREADNRMESAAIVAEDKGAYPSDREGRTR